MKTAILIERFDVSRGGAEVYAAELSKALLEGGHSVDVFCGEGGSPVEGVRVHEIERSGATRSGRIRGFARACAEAVGGQGFDVVMGVGRTLGQDVLMPPGGMISGARAGTIRSMTNPVEQWMRRAGWLAGSAARAAKAVERRQFDRKGRTHFVINSKMVLADLKRDYRIDEQRIHLMYTGVDTRRFRPETRLSMRAEARAEMGLREDETVFLFAGHNFRLKGLEPLLEACAGLVEENAGEFRLIVAGGGAGKRVKFERQTERLALDGRVIFVGATQNMIKLYAAADAVVHPTFYDPLSNVTLEGWACGLPTITSRFNGAAELMTGELEQWTIDDPADGKTMQTRMRELMEPARRISVGGAFRKLAENHDMRMHCAEVVRLFEQVRVEKERR